MQGVHKFWRRDKTGKAGGSGATKEREPAGFTTTTKTTLLSATDGVSSATATSVEQRPELYATAGPTGIRVVVDPADAILDIVFVHGLTGGRDTTWTYKKGKEAVFWPELLAQDIRGARTMAFGYDADVVKFWEMAGGNTLRTHGKNLASAVSDQRRTCRERPLIFIAHSLGGLVCEQALLCCGEGDSHLEKVFQSTRGIVFMGTPHAGADLADLGFKLAKCLNVIRRTNSAIMGPLRQGSEVLTAVQQQFQQLLRKPNVLIEIYCFFEEKAVGGVGLIVPEQSATLAQYPNQSIAANHMDMTKFVGKNDDGYQKVLNRVRDILESIGFSTAAEYDRKTSEDRSCLESLSFPEISYRREDADQAYLDTCEWILQHPSYTRWISQQSGLLWIKGKPGSGKSTLMAFIYRNTQQDRLANRDLKLHFFFHGRGTALQKTPIGMYRSLLHQLYDQAPLIRSTVRASYLEKAPFGKAGTDWEWQHKELEQLFSNALLRAGQSRRITIFVDALDEAGSTIASRLANYFHDLNDKLAAAKCAAKIAISCRHYPIVAVKSLDICVEDENNEDIRKYVNHRLITETLEPDPTAFSIDEGEELVETIVERSRGVWQWASLVTQVIIDLCHQGESLIYINEKLNSVPEDLGEVYEHILKKVIESRNRPRTLHLIQWVCLAERPLSVTELRFALASDDAYIGEPREFYKDFSETDMRMEKLILSLSGGLVEVKHYEDGTAVQFIHQSVNDFLRSSGLHYLVTASTLVTKDGKDLTSITDPVIGQSQDRLCKSCINYLRLEEVIHFATSTPTPRSNDTDEYEGKLKNTLPFGDYATKHWFLHAEKAENSGVEQQHLVEKLGSPPGPTLLSWVKICQRMTFISRCPSTSSTLLHIASASNLRSVVQILGNDTLNVNEQDSSGRTPLHYAALWGHDELTKMLLQAGAKVDVKDQYENTPLVGAAGNGHDKVVEVLLSRGADVNERTGWSGNALQAAAENGNRKLVCILLDIGADVNAHGGKYGNALYAASSEGHEAVVRLLLEKGADVNAQGGEYGNALQAASWRGDEKVVRLLLEKGADVNAQGGYYGNALQAASWRGDEKVVRLLLEKGADVNAQGGYYGNALQAASSKGNEAVVRLLLEKRAGVHAEGGKYGNALQAATSEAKEAVVMLLLAMGAKRSL